MDEEWIIENEIYEKWKGLWLFQESYLLQDEITSRESLPPSKQDYKSKHKVYSLFNVSNENYKPLFLHHMP